MTTELKMCAKCGERNVLENWACKNCACGEFISLKDKKVWGITISQNGWEYSGWIKLTASDVKKVAEDKIIVDGVLIEFVEEIKEPIVIEEIKK